MKTVPLAILFFVTLTCAQNSFKSVYTAIENFRDAFDPDSTNEGSDIPQICDGLGDYFIYDYFSGSDTYRSIDNHNDTFSVTLAPHCNCEHRVYGRKIEWRLYNDEPFAVIYRVACYGDSALDNGSFEFKENKTGEYLIVRGLKWVPIDEDIDIMKSKII
jgi:hypothetical protein